MRHAGSVVLVLIAIASAMLIYFAVIPKAYVPGPGGSSNRLVQHFLAYLVYGGLLYSSIYFKNRFPKTLATAVAFGLAFALFTEVLQLFAPTRVFTLLDIGVNWLGVLAGLYLLAYLYADSR